jgi:hypothetical protein
MPRSWIGDLLYRQLLRSPLYLPIQSATNQFAGRTVLGSGQATVTVSTTVVDSDSLILLSAEAATNQASGFARAVEVKSISPGNFFAVGWADGVAAARNTTIAWVVFKTQ